MTADQSQRDHQELEPKIIYSVNNSNLLSADVKNTHLIRLTNTEYSFVSGLNVDEEFSHISLQHFGIPHEFDGSSRYHSCLKIIKHGTNTQERRIPPVVDATKFILVEFLGYSHSYLIDTPENHPNPLLGDAQTIHDAIHRKYKSSMNVTYDDLLHMQYYVRSYKKLGELNIS